MPKLSWYILILTIATQVGYSIYYGNQIIRFDLEFQEQRQTITSLKRDTQLLEIEWAKLNKITKVHDYAQSHNMIPIKKSISLPR